MRYLFFPVISFLLAGLTGFAQTVPPPKPPPRGAGQAPAAAQPAPPAVLRFSGHLSPDPAQFIVDAGTMLLATGNPGAKVVAEQLRQLWGSNQLTSSQQRTIAALSQQMLDKKFRPIPHLVTFYATVVSGKTRAGLSDQQLDQFLETLGQAVAKSPATEVEKYLTTTNRALGTGYIYRTGFNSLRVRGGQWSFAYKSAAQSDPTASFDSPGPASAATPAPKPAAAKPAAAKAKPKPAAKKKRASDGWDTGDLWSSKPSKNDGWSNDGWGAPVAAAPKKKAAAAGWGSSSNDGWGAPAKKKVPVAKAGAARPAAAKPAASVEPAPTAADFEQANQPFVPSPLAALATYYPPAVSGPVLELKNADLTVASAGDSLVLHQLSGTVAPGSQRLLATGAEISWTIKGNPASAVLEGFDFDLSKPEFTAQPATLTYAYLLEAPVKGALSYKAVRRKPGATESSYPRFISLTNNVRLKNVGPGIVYEGGLSLAGSLVRSAALDGSFSRLKVSQDGKLRFRATSRNFLLGDSLLTAGRAAVALYQGTGDSITHPGVELKYAKTQQQLKLLYEQGVYRTTPYTDWYHQVYIRAQLVTWNFQDPKINFAIVTNPRQVSADFESRAFFSNTRYQQLKSINHLHPLQLLVGYSRDHDNQQQLNLHEVATETKTSEANLRSAVRGLVREGYADVDPQTGAVELLPKGRAYVGSAREKKDYDNINIHSLSGSGRSATLDLATNQLLVRGVQAFRFTDDSAAVPVIVRPDSGVVRLLKNRDMQFSGRVKTSIYGFKGKDFHFDYDGYFIDMPRIDSLTIRSKTKRVAGKPDLEHRPSDFVLSNKGKTQSGRLFLNDPKNRSGRKKLPRYPAFNSTSGAYVYFNKPDVLGGAYDSTTYFDVPPFTFDSMSTGKSRAGFVGVFHSKALPPIKTALTTQDDGSLGFVHAVPAGGYPLYGGKGKLVGGATVKLNSQGLQSNGTVNYLGATLQSDRFVLYGDSLTGEGKAGSIAASKNTPKVTLPPGYLINWVAKSDSLYLQSPPEGAAMKLYADHTFKGSLLLTPKGLGGAGRLDGPQSYVRSENLTFGNDTYSGEKGLLSVKSATAGKPALTANNVDFTYDLKKGYADFRGDKEGKSAIELPYSDFRTSLSGGRWDFKQKRVTLRASGADSARAVFASTKPEQHGLKFKAKAAEYDLAKYQLQAKGVPYVAAGDAWIIPDSGRVAVGGGGQLRQLHHATVLLDSAGRYHKLVNGNITVVSRDAFKGDAQYMSRTTSGDSVALRFSDFQPDSAAMLADAAPGKGRLGGLLRRPASEDQGQEPPAVATIATANVEANQKFQLAPSIGYRGPITLNSQKRGLNFDGQVQLQFGRKRAPGTADWFAVKDSIDPKNIALSLHNLKSEDGTALATGFFLSDSDNGLYPLYAGPVAGEGDIALFKVDGTLRYDLARGEYTVADHDLTDPNKLAGTALAYHEATNRFNFSGPLSFIANNKNYAVVGSGVGVANPDSALYQVRSLLGIDAAMPAKATERMAAVLAKVLKNAPEAFDGSNEELTNIAQLAGDKGAEAFANRRAGVVPSLGAISPKLVHTLLLSRVDLRWNPKQKAWRSVGKIGLGGAGKQALDALVEGYVEIKRQDAQDVVEVYLEPEPGTYYYLRYANNVLLTKSSDDEGYDAEIAARQKGSMESASDYGVFLGEQEDVDRFRSHFERDYLGKSGRLAARPAAPQRDEAEVDASKSSKKKKKAKATDPFAEGTAEPAADPTAEPGVDTDKKARKKKKKDSDPFGEGTAEPAAEPAVDAGKKPKKEKAKAPEPAADPSAEPAEEPRKKKKARDAEPAADPTAAPTPEPEKKAKKEKARDAEPAADPDAEPAVDTGKKAKKKAKEAEPAPDPNAEPTTDDSKKAKKKKKKEEAEDPFGDS